MKPFGRFGTRLRAELRAWFSSRAELARLEAERVERAERLEREAAEALKRADELAVRNNSLAATVSDRTREIEQLRAEGRQKDATLALRELEIEELNQWLERVRVRLNADIAEQVAREGRAIGPPNPKN